MEIMAFDPFLDKKSSAWNNVKNVDLEKLLKSSDVISVHTPLTESTRHLINSPNLNIMKKFKLKTFKSIEMLRKTLS